MKNTLIILSTVALSFILALPSFFPKTPTIIIPANNFSDSIVESVGEENIVNIQLIDDKYHLNFKSIDKQVEAARVISADLGISTYQLNLKPSTPKLLPEIALFKPIGLGLDLSGGVFLSFSINIDDLKSSYLNKLGKSYNKTLSFDELRSSLSDTHASVREIDGSPEIYLDPEGQRKLVTQSVNQIISVIKNRVDELGVGSSSVYREGEGRIIVEMPGIQDIQRAKDIIGSTSTVEFRLEKPFGYNAEILLDNMGVPHYLVDSPRIDGESIVSAVARLDSQSGSPKVSITLDIEGGKIMKKMTSKNIGKPMASVLIESFYEDGELKITKRIINSASIGEELSTRFEITGMDSMEDAQRLALFLRTGNFSTPIIIENEQVIAPSLGEKNVRTSFISMVIGLLVVFTILFIRYGAWYGLVANTSMVVTLFLIIFILSQIGAALTLAGVAGLLLTVGMSVDSSVIIFEKIRKGFTGDIDAALIDSFKESKSSILDANLTTVFAAVMLYIFGSTTIKSFSITLIIGIFISLAVMFIYTKSLVVKNSGSIK